jgi:hypothetical protein
VQQQAARCKWHGNANGRAWGANCCAPAPTQRLSSNGARTPLRCDMATVPLAHMPRRMHKLSCADCRSSPKSSRSRCYLDCTAPGCCHRVHVGEDPADHSACLAERFCGQCLEANYGMDMDDVDTASFVCPRCTGSASRAPVRSRRVKGAAATTAAATPLHSHGTTEPVPRQVAKRRHTERGWVEEVDLQTRRSYRNAQPAADVTTVGDGDGGGGGAEATDRSESMAMACAVCLSGFVEMSAATPIMRLSRCNHVYCEPCIRGWWKEAKDNSCPVCRLVYSSLRNCELTTAGEWLNPQQVAPEASDGNGVGSDGSAAATAPVPSKPVPKPRKKKRRKAQASGGGRGGGGRPVAAGWSGAAAAAEPVEWAQCEAPGCGKWRVLPPHVRPACLPEQFECSMSATWAHTAEGAAKRGFNYVCESAAHPRLPTGAGEDNGIDHNKN